MSVSSAVSKKLGTLRVHGPDVKGVVAACFQFLIGQNCNIVKSEQWSDRQLFFQRINFEYQHHIEQNELQNILNEFGHVAHLDLRERKQRVAVMVSKYDHCLWELLLRHSAHELDCEIPLVISNHPKLHTVADTFGIPFKVFPITKDNKLEQEQRELELLNEYQADVVVLARYMQVLSENFLHAYPNRIINIHHSFLPAFSGGRAYHAAHERGVKLIGATAHYATPDLDEGPIIEQDVIQVTHRDEVHDFIRKGRILERNVLVRALEAHLDDRVTVYNNKCVVFND